MSLWSNPENFAYLIPGLPGLAFFVIVIGLILNRKLFMKLGSYVSICAIAGAAVVASLIFFKMISGGFEDSHNYIRPWAFEFFNIGNLQVSLGIALDGISTFMLFMVTVVACLIQIYSTGYMAGDPHYGRYFAYHSLFVCSMLLMVISDNLLGFFIGWELMGLCSYLLIGFFYQKHSAAEAQKKAFLVTKLGDVLMFVGIMLLGFLVFKAGIKTPVPEGTKNPSTQQEETFKITKHNYGNISFQFTDPRYEALIAADKDLPQDERLKLYYELFSSNIGLIGAYAMVDEVLREGQTYRIEVVKRYIGREMYVTKYLPYITMVLSDPEREELDRKGEIKRIGVGSKRWDAFCDGLKTDPRYLVWLYGWPEFVGETDIETRKNWAEFCEGLKTLKPRKLYNDAKPGLTGYLTTLLNQQESRKGVVNPGPRVKPYNPLVVKFAEYHLERLNELKPEVGSYGDYVAMLSFIEPYEAAAIITSLRQNAKKYLNGEDGVIPDSIYAGSFKKFADRFSRYAMSTGFGGPDAYADYRQLQREIRNEQEKYLDRPITIKEIVKSYDWEGAGLGWLLTLAALLLFCGAIGKSAQVPLHAWLPDAMEGPTPVSALIHAATMVAAGVYLVGRFYFLFDAAPGALETVAVIGAITAFGAATIGLVMNDIKRVLAYSTISQLGFMMIGLGVGSLTAGIFHLLAHAYFKALLFLGSGSVIHGSGTQDMREMGGLKKKMPWTYWTFMAGTLALCGIFPFAGFWSKDEVLGAAFKWASEGPAWHWMVWILGVAGAFLTAFYMFRLISMTFYGKFRGGDHHVHESPPSMLIPLIILAVFATGYGLIGMPFNTESNIFGKFIHFGAQHEFHWWPTGFLMFFSLAVALAGVFAGLRLLKWGSPFKETMKQRFPGFYRTLCSKYYFDETYSFFTVLFLFTCRVMRLFDMYIIDGIVNAVAWIVEKLAWIKGRFDLYIVDGAVNLVGWLVESMSKLIRPIQSGYIQNAMLMVVIFVVGVLLVTLLK